MYGIIRFLKWAFAVIAVIGIASLVAGLSFRSGLGTPITEFKEKAVYAPNGVVATSQPLASQAGLAVLQNGGNAVDAAVTAAAVLSVVEPYMTGIGGDMFAMVWLESEQRLIGINGSGHAGALMTLDKLAGRNRVPDEGAQSITLPGALSGWAMLLQTHGTISLAQALAPAIALAENGFPISKTTAQEWGLFESKINYDKGARSTFLMDGARTPLAGEWFVNPDYANTLKLIAAEGPKVLYGGELGEKIAARVQELGGFLTQSDFANYQAQWVEPMSVSYKAHRLWELPPNGQGIAALEMLKMLEPYDLKAMQHNSASYLHHLIEAKKLAYADLEHFVGDPEFMQIQAEQLLDDAVIAKRRALIKPEQAMQQAEPEASLTTSDTTYLSVADKDGNMVSFINSIAGPFGAGVVVPGTGFALQNRGVGLSLQPDRANTVAPGRKPFHTIIPGFVTKADAQGKQQPWLSFGIVGGPQQPQAHVQMLLNMVEFGMDVQEAIDAPRFRHWQGNSVSFEQGIPQSTVDELYSLGHAPQNPVMATVQGFFHGNNPGLVFGGGQAVMKTSKGYVAGSDSRRDGVAAAH
ncbi:MAG: gamma-glutamyltransferase [Gammaproteobacteria bacterium]|nr:gamma-glutamyltransferase [Gammaproteobacteria bacterium]MBU2068963.1 gamma-glutamyltransferase [Gammaproteobacteria bacterium]MBU2181469.1 gamma-glutamyltransferase [Gammaproteobacteria bacterium]MBU2206614.1 gamma-glutamyltransferase [Gammaproteobacteria bacterium]